MLSPVRRAICWAVVRAAAVFSIAAIVLYQPDSPFMRRMLLLSGRDDNEYLVYVAISAAALAPACLCAMLVGLLSMAFDLGWLSRKRHE